MTRPDFDIALVGGGLAGGLTALALAQTRSDVRVTLLEGGPALGGNHRWSWFESDLSPAGAALMDLFPSCRWDGGYDVAFPGFSRTLPTPYRSLASADFAAVLAERLPRDSLRCGAPAASLDADGVTLASGERITARTVIDCRGFEATAHLSGGWQVFLGRHVRTAAPHGIERPIIMDATVEQLGGYRFVYVLPLSADEVFVEDTYYQDTPMLDREVLSRRLDAYCAGRGWASETIGEETGVLPVVTGGDFAAYRRALHLGGVGVAGVRGGFFHPLTSYSLPFAVATALDIAAHADHAGEQMAEMLTERARRHWRAMQFFRRLGAMMFGASPAHRWRVFERFYGLDSGLIERFYAGRHTLADRVRILWGKPPIPLSAVGARQPPLSAAA